MLITLLILVISARGQLFPAQPPPEQLPLPPSPAVAIVGGYSPGFFAADLYVRTADGPVYHQGAAGGAGAWEPIAAVSGRDGSEECARDSQQELEAAAGPLIACRAVQTTGEWCPGNLVSFGITEQGEVWRVDRVWPCTFMFGIGLSFCMPVALLAGGLLALLLYLVNRRQRMNSPRISTDSTDKKTD